MSNHQDTPQLRPHRRLYERIRNDDFRFPKFLDAILFLLLIAVLTLIYSPMALRLPYLPEVGEVATRNIKASRDLLIEDVETTLKRRQQEALSVPPIYDWDSGMVEPIIHQLEEALTWLETTHPDSRVSVAPLVSMPINTLIDSQIPISKEPLTSSTLLLKPKHSLEEMKARKEAFSQKLEEAIPDKAYQSLLGLNTVQSLFHATRNWLNSLNQKPVVSSLEVLKDLSVLPYYVVHSIYDGSNKQVSGTTGVIDLAGMRQLLGETITSWLGEFPPEVRQWLLEEVRTQIRPNLVLNLSETQAKRMKAYNAVEPVYFQAKRGQMVIREGAVVTEPARLKIEAMNQNRWTYSVLWRIIGLAATLGSLLWVGRWFLMITSTAFPRDRKTSYILGSIVLVTSILCAMTYAVGQGLVELLNWPADMVVYLPHVALGSALASLIVGARAGIPGGALILGTTISFLSAVVANGGLPLFIYYLIGSMVGGATLRTCRKRFDVLRCGLRVGLAQMFAMPIVELLAGHDPSWNWLLGGGMALSSGLLAGLWGLALIPLFESLFNITTDSRLIELASGDHPLVRELSLRSPGTYHHSVMMGNLAEAAAESIHANPLLARVMALYHDIGKMNSPHYFVENQSGENRHDNLSPSMSTKVIMAHVKNGLDLAQKYKLGGPIQEAIVSHHGTSLLQYFYNRAINLAAKRQETISSDEYRYPGPKPRSKEAGILMLADSVEAAARSLKTPSPAQIQSLVKRIFGTKIDDGQLDECRLTLREMARIEMAFTRVLTLGFYHHRIEYPDQVSTHRKILRNNGKNSSQVRPQSVASG